ARRSTARPRIRSVRSSRSRAPSSRTLESGGRIASGQDERSNGQDVHPRSREAVDRLAWGTNDRFVLIEGRIEEDGNAGELLAFGDQPPIEWLDAPTHRLESSATVHVRRRRDRRALLRTDAVRHGHERRGLAPLEVSADCFLEDGRGEGTKELAALDSRVEHVPDLETTRVSQDAAIPERSRAPLHSPLEPANNLTVVDLPRDTPTKTLAGRAY